MRYALIFLAGKYKEKKNSNKGIAESSSCTGTSQIFPPAFSFDARPDGWKSG